MEHFLPWLQKKIPERMHHILVKVFLSATILIVGLELGTVLNFIYMKFSVAPEGMWQKMMFMLPNFPFAMVIQIILVLLLMCIPFFFL